MIKATDTRRIFERLIPTCMMMVRVMRTSLLLLYCFIFLKTSGFAQDTHYWTNPYGSRTALLGGAVVSGVQDNAMVLYNPGALGFIENNSLSVNASVYRLEDISIKSALGDEADFESDHFSTIPILISGMINLKHKNWKVGYALVAPIQFDFSATARLDDDYDIVDDQTSPGKELFIAETEKRKKLFETTGALGLSRKYNDQWSFGMSQLFTLRSLQYRDDLLVHLVLNDDVKTPVSTTLFTETNYYHVRYQIKLGANYRNGPWRLGLALTSPSLRLFGNGSVAADLTTTNLLINGERKDIFASDRQQKIKTKYEAPFSISFGSSYELKNGTLFFTTEYFAGVVQYTILQPAANDFFRGGDVEIVVGSDEILQIEGGAKDVINFAVAYERRIDEKRTIQASFRTDQSYLLPKEDVGRRIHPEVTSWNVYHLTAGVTAEREKSSMSIGAMFGYGRNKAHEEQGNVGGGMENNIAVGSTIITSANYISVGILLGYKFNYKRM